MPFTFEPLEVTREGNELVLRGRVVTGAYFGPEPVVLRSPTGDELPSHIHSHGIEYPEGWPVLPEHRESILILRIPLPPPEFKIATITGLGAIEPATERVDISHVVTEPEFWAMQLALHFTPEDTEDPGLEWLGVRPKAAEDWFEVHVQCHIDRGIWPYVRVQLPSSQYIELEMAGGIEYQDRIWIGHISGGQRTLLGYKSGHFSLPALRIQEVFWLAELTDWSPNNLLWLSAVYLEDGMYPISEATRLVSGVPGLVSGNEAVMAEALLRNLAVEGLKWVPDQTLGWINNGDCSQRNPKSLLSILKGPDFTYIRQFFS